MTFWETCSKAVRYDLPWLYNESPIFAMCLFMLSSLQEGYKGSLLLLPIVLLNRNEVFLYNGWQVSAPSCSSAATQAQFPLIFICRVSQEIYFVQCVNLFIRNSKYTIRRMWTKLLATTSIKEGLKGGLVKGIYKQPLIYGHKKAELRKMFRLCELPWIYENNELHSPQSPYNRGIKESKQDKRFTKRLAEIQRLVAQADDKELEYRRQRANRLIKPEGIEKFIVDMLGALGMREKIVDKKKKLQVKKKSETKGEQHAKSKKVLVKKMKSEMETKAARKVKEKYDLIAKQRQIFVNQCIALNFIQPQKIEDHNNKRRGIIIMFVQTTGPISQNNLIVPKANAAKRRSDHIQDPQKNFSVSLSPDQATFNGLSKVTGILCSMTEHWSKQRWTKQKELLEEYREKYEDGELQFSDIREYINKRYKKEGSAFASLVTKPHNRTEDSIPDPAISEIQSLLQRPNLPTKVKEDLEFQLKLLKLQAFQQKLKKTIIGNSGEPKPALEKVNLLEKFLVDRQFYTRARILPHSDRKGTKTLERYELQMRTGQEQRKKAKHKEFLQELAAHAREFLDFHKKKYQILKKRAAQAKAHIENIGKKEQHDKDKNERERIKMLKANDIERYLDIVNTAKNSRLLEILNQTQQYLEQLREKVALQKQEAAEIVKNRMESAEEHKGMPFAGNMGIEGSERMDSSHGDIDIERQEEENKHKEGLLHGSKEYYKITHTITEEIKEDPKTLKGGKLKSYQLQGLEWLVSLYNNNLNGILADEMGLGKTIQTIALFCYLMENKGNDGPFLIVVPLSTLTNWDLEFDKWCPKIKKLIYKGDPATRKYLANQMRYEKFNVVLTTYEYIIKDKGMLSRIAWQYIVVDEGHRMKNYKCKFALILGQQYQSAHRLLLTGTPLQNNLSELWALLNFLLPKIFASCEDFEKWFNRPFSKYGVEKDVPLNEEERLLVINRLHQVLRPFLLRRMKKEVEQELPNKVEYVLKVDLSAWQKIYYNQLKKHGMLAMDPSTGKIGSRSLMNTLMQLRKICNHPYLFLSSYSDDFLIRNIWRCSGKFELLDRMLPKLVATGHKVLIFSQMTQLMDIMKIYFNIKGLRHLRLDGTTKADDRGHWTHLFNSEASEYKIFLLSTRAGGLGLNLQAADTVIIFDSDFNPQMDLQAQDRAHRIGQKHEVRVYRLVTNTKVEEDILSRAAMKKNLDNVVIQAGLFNQKASDIERRKKLEDLLRQDEKNTDEEDDAVPDDEQINEFLARNEQEFQEYQNMDYKRYINEDREAKIKEIMERLGLSSFPKNFNYRLMQDYEVPEWVTQMPTEEKKETISGKRMRKKVNYADDITERQWEKCIEEGRDPNDEVERIREVKELKKRKKVEDEDIDLGEEEGEVSINDPNSTIMRIRIPIAMEEGFGKVDNSEEEVEGEEEPDEVSVDNRMVRVRIRDQPMLMAPEGEVAREDLNESEMSPSAQSFDSNFDNQQSNNYCLAHNVMWSQFTFLVKKQTYNNTKQ
eukprot:TRINITY_DN43_c9_g1_i1.p1 TRINITY_DN43_c9_g1~~TRINITY_DN43_c9_g1_i1.p1  ORF type:complete len:1498 (-),score=197.37 TRINITY_DN43_c9_g1_i1:969-5462(-)